MLVSQRVLLPLLVSKSEITTKFVTDSSPHLLGMTIGCAMDAGVFWKLCMHVTVITLVGDPDNNPGGKLHGQFWKCLRPFINTLDPLHFNAEFSKLAPEPGNGSESVFVT